MTETPPLLAFINARLDDDEELAHEALKRQTTDRRMIRGRMVDVPMQPMPEWRRSVWPPDRVLREVKAKRLILARHAGCGLGTGWCDDGGHGWDEELGGGCPELGDMALPYASHPDYDERWKP